MLTYTENTYIKHYAEEGMVLTEWKEGDDIITFSYAKVAICPINKECNWREITESEKDILETEQLRILAEMEK